MVAPGRPLTIGFPNTPGAIGGPSSFQLRLSRALTALGHRCVGPSDDVWPDVVMVVAGTSKVGWLVRCKRRGARIVHRLDGLIWRHRVEPLGLGLMVSLEARNGLMRMIRDELADHVVYQSEFVQGWWRRRFGLEKCPSTIIHNAVNLSDFEPAVVDPGRPRAAICVEGVVPDETPSMAILRALPPRLVDAGAVDAVYLCGQVSDAVRRELSAVRGLVVKGSIPRDEMRTIYARSDIYISLEVHPPCPNSVIESLASGLPVTGFDTGSLAELVPPEAGAIVPYGSGDPWRLDPPDIDGLEAGIRAVLDDLPTRRRAARAVAEARYGIDRLTADYLGVFERVLRSDVDG